MQIILGGTAGFCMGVRRALKMVLQAANDPAVPTPIKTVGPLIHNSQVMKVVQTKGVGVLEEGDPQPVGTAVIRAHGISPDEQRELEKRCQKIIDATCPRVRRVQRIVEKHAAEGYHCIVVGDEGHAEVKSVLGFAGSGGTVVNSIQQVRSLPPMGKVAVVAQTTQNAETFALIVEELRSRYPDCEVFDTICKSAYLRQSETRKLAGEVEAVVVVGGFHSANTRRLAEVSRAAGATTLHVEAPEQLDFEKLLRFERIGVTAGASTPNWMIRRVIRGIRSEHNRRQRNLSYFIQQVLSAPIHSNMYIGAGAAALTFANSMLLEVPFLWTCAALAFFFIASQHILNQYGRREAIYLNDAEKAEFFKANEGVLLLLGASCGGMALLLAFLLGWTAFVLILVGLAAGLLYRLRLSDRLGGRLGVNSLEQVPGSKELFVGLAWAVTTSIVPAVAARSDNVGLPGVMLVSAFSFLLAFERALLADLREVEGDQLMGRETLAIVLDRSKARAVFAAAAAAQLPLLLALGWLTAQTTTVSFALLPVIPYMLFCFWLYERGKLPEGLLGEALIDGAFYLCGILALLWVLV